MQVWPAIDLRGGRCVRLQQGDYDRELVFSNDPAEMAAHWVAQGAHRLHLVDLDGARTGRLGNMEPIRAILATVKVPCQLGGGIRDAETIEQLLALGIARVVVGTRALKDPEWFEAMCKRFPHKLCLGIDARDGQVATEGWMETSTTPAIDLARRFESHDIAAIIFTDIATDGMLAGPNLAAMAAMQASISKPVIASGGVTTVDDVTKLASVPMAGCIIGRALYEGRMRLAEALSAAGDDPPVIQPAAGRDF